jgi:hypothetical protein
MIKIHRYIEPIDENISLLHDVYYEVVDGLVAITGLSTHRVENSIVGQQLISPDKIHNNIILIAAQTILFSDKVMDLSGKYLL